MTVYEQKQQFKKVYIPRVAAGSMTLQKASQLIGISINSVFRLKKRYLKDGDKIFIRGNTGHPAYNKKYTDQFITHILFIYHRDWEGCPYATFQKALKVYEDIDIPYTTLRYILKKENIKAFRQYKTKEKPKHESRKERPCTGDLIQLDASKHDWFMNGTYTNLHGAIDDATHRITGLYFCNNECRLGYNEVLRQTFLNYGIPEAVYIDRHSSFVTTPKGKDITLEERLYSEHHSDTHFTQLCRQLDIEIILALSAQGKGRIERLWSTLQGILPFFFRRNHITDNDTANAFLMRFIPRFNKRFSVVPERPDNHFKKFYKKERLDYLLSIKEKKKTDSYGFFMFHDHYFELIADRRSHKHFELCLSEQYGLKAFMNGKFYDVQLAEGEQITSVLGSHMPLVEQDLISRYLEADLHTDLYKVI